jgi:DNA-binding XRE family transcriptional regulator
MRRFQTTISVASVNLTTSDQKTSRNDVTVRLRLEIHDALAAKKGAHNVAAQAALHGIHRSTMFRIRSGERMASLELALRMAARLEVPVEVLFERTRRSVRHDN